MPCLEWFAEQSAEYQERVLPASVRARVSVEAGSAQGWWRYVGDQGACVSIDHFGASAAGAELFEQLGFTAENVANVARSVLARVG
jgi:transketolase